MMSAMNDSSSNGENGKPARAAGGKSSVVHLTRAWYPICTSDELGEAPLARKIYASPLVVFRGEGGRPGVLLDRCAHRNVPLSLGRVKQARLECAYHGWQYDAAGSCRLVPGLCGAAELPSRKVASHPVREQDGFVWLWADVDSEPDCEPYALPGGDGYTSVRRVVEVKATLHAAIENALDVPHTAFLHKGLFRGTGKTNVINAVVTRDERSVTTEYIGEPRPEGIAAQILSPSGGVVTHHDRFILPSIAQVDYSVGSEIHILVSSICTPVEDFVTRMYAVVSFRTRLPGWLVKQVLDPIAMKIFSQDAAILQNQTAAIQRFGGEDYVSTELDLMGPQVLRLLRRAAERKPPKEGDASWRREIQLEV
jgi:phenylpropionate dioxygenase-like ring-hydroxylating dioxygenase large terminal subunit